MDRDIWQLRVQEVAQALIVRLRWLQGGRILSIPKPNRVLNALGHASAEKIDMKKQGAKTAQFRGEGLRALLEGPGDVATKLSALKEKVIGDCKRCKLCGGRANIVFGAGSAKAKLVFVGEAPGAEEDRQAKPFVGRAGQLLTKMIEAMGFSRENVYICNVVKCRPPDNRDPEPDEVEACEPFLKAQLALIQPQVIVALGRYACQCLLRTSEPMGKIRGQWSRYEKIPLMPTFHPAYLLRSPSKKKEVWQDLQAVMEFLRKSKA